VPDYDVVIVGAGSAGATAALNLAPFRRVLLVDRWPGPRVRIGESLPGAARRLLIDMGLWTGFAADGHAPRHAHRGVWGEASPVERDALADPDGHGWHLDRARFEGRLRATAVARGAILLAPARPLALARDGDGWRLRLEVGGQVLDLGARLIVDAAGRASRLLSGLGPRRAADDRLVCAWLRARADLPDGVTQIEVEAGGWWYAAPLPHGEAVLAFHTDADLPQARLVRDRAALLERARSLPMLGGALASAGWDDAGAGYCAAHGATLSPPAGPDWIAVGDAALAFDPLSSQGLFNALYTGLAGAETADRLLSGEAGAAAEYVDDLDRVRQTYVRHLAAWYGLERRWPGAPFWARRHTPANAVVQLARPATWVASPIAAQTGAGFSFS
jgi:flavin-dependent dehydrogenase